jgi:aspartate-semialdehyde dehydrogenase
VSSRGYTIPDSLHHHLLTDIADISREKVQLVFSAFDGSKSEILKTESELANRGFMVVSNNSAHRWTPDVPMMLPEVNPDNLSVLETQESYINNR